MSIKIHLVFSFLIHSLVLTYFLTLPIYKSSIDTLSFRELFVYLQSEEGRGAEGLSSTGKKSDSQVRGNERGENETTPVAQKVDKEKITEQKEVFSKEQVMEIIRSGVVEQKVFEAGEASQEVKEKVEHPEKKKQKTDGIKDASLYAQKAPEDTGEPSREGVIVYEGTILKTMPGSTVIPYEEASRVEILHARREEATETKDKHDTEVLAKQQEPPIKEVEKEKRQEQVEVIGVRKDETHEEVKKEIESIKKEIYRGRGLLSKEAAIKVSSLDKNSKEDVEIHEKAEPKREVLKGDIAEVEQPGDKHIPMKEVRPETPQKFETGLLLGSVKGRMAIPSEEAETQIEKQIQAKVEAKEQVETAQQIEKETDKAEQIENQIEIVKHTDTDTTAQIGIEKELETKEKVGAEVKVEVEEQKQIQIEKKTKKEPEIKTEKETETKALLTEDAEIDVSKVVKLHEETEPKTPAEVDAGLFLKTLPGTMTIPLKDELPRETLLAQKRVLMKEHGKQEGERYEGEKESVQEPFEFEEPFDRSRVEEKLKYLESAMKEKNKKIKGKGTVTEEPEPEMLTEKIPVPGEKHGETDKPVVEIVKSSLEQAYPENDQEKKGKETDLKEEAADTQQTKESSMKQIDTPDISEIEAGLLLTSVPGKPTVPFEQDLKRPLLENRAGEKKEPQEKASEKDTVPDKDKNLSEAEKLTLEKDKEVKKRDEVIPPQEIETQAEEISAEPLIERIVDMPFAVRTEKPEGSYQTNAQKEINNIENRSRVIEEAVNPGNSKIASHEGHERVSSENNRQVPAEVSTVLEEGSGAGEKKPLIGISLPDAFFKKDIKIEISMPATETAEVSFQLIKKGHPLDEKKDSMTQKEIELVEDTKVDYTEGYKRVFSTAKAEKGVYIFVIKNNGLKGYEADVLFSIFEGRPTERRKEYKTIALPPNTTLKYKFIIPEGVFWDDEDYFTGTIESSKTLTKFNEKTGLIWKEEKDR
jgi:hypothetical protein